MNGFQRELKERIFDTIPHASILGKYLLKNLGILKRSYIEEVLGVAPYIETQGLLSSGSYLKAVYFFGVVPKYERSVSSISDHIIAESFLA